MKKKIVEKRSNLHPLDTTELVRVTGGGLSGPDQCVPIYKLVCVQTVTPLDTQDT